MSQLWYLLARWSWKISWRQILYVHIGVKSIYLSIIHHVYNLCPVNSVWCLRVCLYTNISKFWCVMNPVAKMTSMLNRLVLHGRVIGAAWWQRGVWLIGRVVATWCLVAFWKQAIFCVVLSISAHLKLTSALSYSCAIMWTQGFWGQCIKSKRVLMVYYREKTRYRCAHQEMER